MIFITCLICACVTLLLATVQPVRKRVRQSLPLRYLMGGTFLLSLLGMATSAAATFVMWAWSSML